MRIGLALALLASLGTTAGCAGPAPRGRNGPDPQPRSPTPPTQDASKAPPSSRSPSARRVVVVGAPDADGAVPAKDLLAASHQTIGSIVTYLRKRGVLAVARPAVDALFELEGELQAAIASGEAKGVRVELFDGQACVEAFELRLEYRPGGGVATWDPRHLGGLLERLELPPVAEDVRHARLLFDAPSECFPTLGLGSRKRVEGAERVELGELGSTSTTRLSGVLEAWLPEVQP